MAEAVSLALTFAQANRILELTMGHADEYPPMGDSLDARLDDEVAAKVARLLSDESD